MESIKIIILTAIVILILFLLKARSIKNKGSRAFENVDPEEFKELMKQQNSVVLDVRTPNEIAGGKITGAIEMDALQSDFKKKLAELDPSKTYLVYCRSGRRSAGACQSMAGMDFRKLYNLSGGYMNWKG